LDNKSFFEDVKRETKTAISKIFHMIEEVSRVSSIKLQISNLRGQIRNNKLEIGEIVTSNIQEFSKFSEINKNIEKILQVEKEILLKKEKIDILQSKVEIKTKAHEDEGTFSK